ncbi:MAG TPA: UMP kinase [Firmicutes bacterium]|uniref:Uridylate kinase n=1 Tax=Candidatus Fermentithermobacillus carboniphilus TaxID=3085328 RepID=A0AAT9LFS3_9FIRM|nr:MAG: UMP kinase [Candidatus Fermentithermobacillus carboniphilus]HHW18188.1 UMP kinase [Candidatus Fermentithermobacillaceae bacterium]
MPKYRRVVLKLSGEALAGKAGFGLDLNVVDSIARQIKDVVNKGVEMSIVVGGGNFWRGAKGEAEGMDRATSDYMGMLATVMNCMALQERMERLGLDTRLMTAIEMREIAEPYIRRKAIHHLKLGRVVIFGAGSGNPYFTTDTTAALRAAEIGAEAILMAKQGTDGVYDSDPNVNPGAHKFERLDYLEVINRRLRVMDATATTLCMDNRIPLIVFDLDVYGNIERAVMGERVGTIVGRE